MISGNKLAVSGAAVIASIMAYGLWPAFSETDADVARANHDSMAKIKALAEKDGFVPIQLIPETDHDYGLIVSLGACASLAHVDYKDTKDSVPHATTTYSFDSWSGLPVVVHSREEMGPNPCTQLIPSLPTSELPTF